MRSTGLMLPALFVAWMQLGISGEGLVAHGMAGEDGSDRTVGCSGKWTCRSMGNNTHT